LLLTIALPIAAFGALGYALRPRGPAVAPLRLAALRAALLLCGGAVLAVEALSALHALTRPAMLALWPAAALAALGAAAARRRRDRRICSAAGRVRRRWTVLAGRLPGRWAGLGAAERLVAAVIAVLWLGELLIALVSPPNNYDSQTYHLPRIEHWVADRDVDMFPTAIVRQVAMPPGAEYLLLHLRLLTGGPAGYNLLQWLAGIGCALLAARIAAQLGGRARAQLLAAFLVATAPIVVLESTSTQTDLVLALWVAAVATLVLDDARPGSDQPRDARPGDVPTRAAGPWAATALPLGTAVGLVAVTKLNGLDAVAPLLLLWLVVRVRRAGAGRALAGAALVGALTLLITGPYLLRVRAEYGNPLGPDYLTGPIAMQRHDPPAVLVNTLRIAQGAGQTPLVNGDHALARGINAVGRAIGVAPDDPRITYPGTVFATPTWAPDEDRAAFPANALLVVIGAALALIRPARRAPPPLAPLLRWYALAWWLAVLAYTATVKWQPWGNRLIEFLLVLAAAPAALWLDGVLPAPSTMDVASRRRALAVAAAVVLLAAGGAGAASLAYGYPRGLAGPGSVFRGDDTTRLFQRRPLWLPGYQQAAAAVRATGARRVGLVQAYDTWEYPWWVLLPDAQLVSLRSLQPKTPAPAPASVDAIVCVRADRLCRELLPAGWQLHPTGPDVSYALPPARSGYSSVGSMTSRNARRGVANAGCP
jgi:4-amino-4-deoxy-L-arabinose transferase-like glycosyltransferase